MDPDLKMLSRWICRTYLRRRNSLRAAHPTLHQPYTNLTRNLHNQL